MAKFFCGIVVTMMFPGCAALSLFGQTHNHTHHHYHNCTDSEIRERLSKLEAKDRPLHDRGLQNAHFVPAER